ncbi:MAG: hypothetical protein ACLGSH_15505 [Acidobacteriota bacterium]
MQVGKKGAFVLLLIAVLWAAAPALACVMPMAHGSCCQGMGMQDCASPAMMHCGDCCRMQSSNAPLPPGSAGAADHAIGSVPAASGIVLVLLPDTGSAVLPGVETPPPGSRGRGSILRI